MSTNDHGYLGTPPGHRIWSSSSEQWGGTKRIEGEGREEERKEKEKTEPAI
jgi:hypothetical protein